MGAGDASRSPSEIASAASACAASSSSGAHDRGSSEPTSVPADVAGWIVGGSAITAETGGPVASRGTDDVPGHPGRASLRRSSAVVAPSASRSAGCSAVGCSSAASKTSDAAGVPGPLTFGVLGGAAATCAFSEDPLETVPRTPLAPLSRLQNAISEGNRCVGGSLRHSTRCGNGRQDFGAGEWRYGTRRKLPTSTCSPVKHPSHSGAGSATPSRVLGGPVNPMASGGGPGQNSGRFAGAPLRRGNRPSQLVTRRIPASRGSDRSNAAGPSPRRARPASGHRSASVSA